MGTTSPVALIVLDGFGYNPEVAHNAIAQAYTPHLDAWFASCPSALLHASGTFVGLPEGSMGNSEVGHITIGAGRVVEQAITRINKAIDNNIFSENPTLKKALALIKAKEQRLHIIGLCSDAKVHSDIKHLYAFLDAAQIAGIKTVFLHLFLDGRDTPPRSACLYLNQLSQRLTKKSCGIIGSLHGRFYAMDRDGNFERTKKSSNVLVGKAKATNRIWEEIVADAYTHGITDEFIEPVLLDQQAVLKSGDAIIFFNIRPDRMRQLVKELQDTVSISPCITPVSYGDSLVTDVLFIDKPIINTLKEILAKNHKTIFVIAETEKYAHVTYFFNGMLESVMVGETRVLIPSHKVKTYMQTPAMKAQEITKTVLATLKNPYDFYLINYANADMVGHSGDLAATIRAIECLDKELGYLYDAFITQHNSIMYITADHGKAEEMRDVLTGQPKTAHTTNLVPFLEITASTRDSRYKKLPLHQLADIAPYILKRMELPVPIEMQRC